MARWSADGEYFGRLEKGAFAYYTSEDCIKQKPLTATNGAIAEAAWSPADSIVAFCTVPADENSNYATRIVIYVGRTRMLACLFVCTALHFLTARSVSCSLPPPPPPLSTQDVAAGKELTTVNRIGVKEVSVSLFSISNSCQ